MTSAAFIPALLASGGDRRITVPRGGNVNVYGASPFPRATLGYASSTANDISAAAFEHLRGVVSASPMGELGDAHAYAAALESLRHRLRAEWGLGQDVAVVFAPSGTDLEFVALALAAHHADRALTNVLAGADEVGSGCALAAQGRLFAAETALAHGLAKGAVLAGFEDTRLAQIAVRDPAGTARRPGEFTAALDAQVHELVGAGRHVLAHAVHGSKTGLVLPDLAGIDALKQLYGPHISFVIDACQARLEGDAIRAYLERDCIVLVTGSKFMGGPPFSGMALIPASLAPRGPLPAGLSQVFRRGEWPAHWSACDGLPEGANPGLLLRLHAAVFELERFGRIAPADKARVIAAFGHAARGLAERLGAPLVAPSLDGEGLHLSTLATLDLSELPGGQDFATAQRWHRVLAARGLRLGQPVRCVPSRQGGWAGTLRISLSMPLIDEFAALDADTLPRRLNKDMSRIADVIEAALRPVVA